ncbi:MAG TPA: hypothetical protein VJZ52_00225 [Candidatus Paceibacterota bacterium]|nr:hypothetical protein [Candidatus Paceibacterota bacterium]
MRNPLSLRVETWLGVVFLLSLTILLVVFMFNTLDNFNSDMDVMVVNANNNQRDASLGEARVRFVELQSQVGE